MYECLSTSACVLVVSVYTNYMLTAFAWPNLLRCLSFGLLVVVECAP